MACGHVVSRADQSSSAGRRVTRGVAFDLFQRKRAVIGLARSVGAVRRPDCGSGAVHRWPRHTAGHDRCGTSPMCGRRSSWSGRAVASLRDRSSGWRGARAGGHAAPRLARLPVSSASVAAHSIWLRSVMATLGKLTGYGQHSHIVISASTPPWRILSVTCLLIGPDPPGERTATSFCSVPPGSPTGTGQPYRRSGPDDYAAASRPACRPRWTGFDLPAVFPGIFRCGGCYASKGSRRRSAPTSRRIP
jgi:hypothetical protein